MKKVKKFPGFNKHLRYYIGLNIFIAAAVVALHVVFLFTKTTVSIGVLELSLRTSLLIVFVALSMLVMGTYYCSALSRNK